MKKQYKFSKCKPCKKIDNITVQTTRKTIHNKNVAKDGKKIVNNII